MKAVIATILALAATSIAAPTGNDHFKVKVTFFGAADAKFTQEFPSDGSKVIISNPLSISHITSAGGATCTFDGINGGVTTVVGAQTVDVGPPQTQVSGACRAF